MSEISQEVCDQLRKEGDIAEAEFDQAEEKEVERKQALLNAEIDKMSKKDAKLVNEYENFKFKKPIIGKGKKIFLCILFFIVSWIISDGVLKIKDSTQIIIAMVAPFVLVVILSLIFNLGARKSNRRYKKLEKTSAVLKYKNICYDLKKNSSEEYKKAEKKFINATDAWFKYAKSNMIFIIAPKSRCEDSINYRKSISLYIDGSKYCGALKAGTHEIELDSGRHHFRFVENKTPFNQDGLLAGTGTVGEYVCNVHVDINSPAMIILQGKNEYLVKEDIGIIEHTKYCKE